MSITRAARDLCLTQSAVSRQIIALEESLGVTLFVRNHRALAFTTEGERLYKAVESIFGTLSEAIDEISEDVIRQPITISASVGVVAIWLVPRLGKLQEIFPDIDVRVAANNRVLDLKSEGIDLAIRYCREDAVPANAIHLFGETILPVAHPTMEDVNLESSHDLRRITLLEYEDREHPFLRWDDWLATNGLSSGQAKAVLRFNQYDQAIQAACAGQGIALGRFPLLDALISDRRLRRIGSPISHSKIDHQYCLVSADEFPSSRVLAVMDWIEAEAAGAIQLSS